MDDILQRMMAIETEAAEIVAKAEKGAIATMDAGRQEAALLQKQLRLELNDEVNELIQKRVSEAEEELRVALEKAEGELVGELAEFRKTVITNKDKVKQVLAFPEVE